MLTTCFYIFSCDNRANRSNPFHWWEWRKHHFCYGAGKNVSPPKMQGKVQCLTQQSAITFEPRQTTGSPACGQIGLGKACHTHAYCLFCIKGGSIHWRYQNCAELYGWHIPAVAVLWATYGTAAYSIVDETCSGAKSLRELRRWICWWWAISHAVTRTVRICQHWN